jgi:uncharacterized protein with HEPN domain
MFSKKAQTMKQALTKAEIIALFCKDMEQPALQMALHNSFRRYANLRDKLAAEYEQITKIPADEFTQAYAIHSFAKYG